MAVLTSAQRSRNAQFQPMKTLLKQESLLSQSLPDRVLQVPGLALGGRCREEAVRAARLALESQGCSFIAYTQLWKWFWARGIRWDYLSFQGPLKMEEVAPTLTPGWTQLDSSQVNYRDERQENWGRLISLALTEEESRGVSSGNGPWDQRAQELEVT
ncbi:Zinc finger protein with KRAB and SCAN domains 4 [Camelus dromedarius]|uniref:Zinc finger protein with KRAB and SCAN domains 4 n=1 Tax=Camelus dromedarius TaxID=9838 RepID=A0A5N4CSS5_CAMDR|nr:Zinc finger protein with KRAB and SCAN domains 4 [Camelus dromedarius]